MKRFLVATVFLFAIVVYQTDGLCNTCSALTGLACVDHDKFKVCSDGVPTSSAITCPPGTVCSPGPQICVAAGTAAPSCAKCRNCDEKNIFACTGYNAFSLCKGTASLDDTVEYICPAGLVCSINAPTICVNGDETGIGATCPWVETTTTSSSSSSSSSTTTEIITTTPDALTHPDSFCSVQGFPGRYEVSSDPNCKQYISCVSSNGAWSGSLYDCPRVTYFNPATQMCGNQPPARCAPTSTSPPSPPSSSPPSPPSPPSPGSS